MACLMCSWKEIATYLGKNVRTVQRWERKGLPIRRIDNRKILMIVREELEDWLEKHFGGRVTGNAKRVPQLRDELFNSWKEIATYLGREIRTVQRWEKELQLPIRRPSERRVFATRQDLDQWVCSRFVQGGERNGPLCWNPPSPAPANGLRPEGNKRA